MHGPYIAGYEYGSIPAYHHTHFTSFYTSAGSSNKYDDDYIDDEALPLGQHTRSGSATASDSARAGSKALPSVKPLASGASDTLTPAQQRELERESAFQASTGSAAASLTGASSTASGKGKASQPSWNTIAAQSGSNAAQGSASLGKPGSVTNLGQSSNTVVKQQSLGDGESDADMEDYDPRAFAVGSTIDSVTRMTGDIPTTGQAQGWNPRTSGANMGARVQPSMGGEEAYDEDEQGDSRNFMVTRDPTDRNSVVNAQLGRDGQLHQHSTGVNAAGVGVTTSPFCSAVAIVQVYACSHHALSYIS